MGCSNCGTGASTLPMGCKSNGNCGTGGCNRTNSYNWIADIILPEDQQYKYYEISYRLGKRKGFGVNEKGINLQTGDRVVLRSDNGYDIGMISLSGELVKLQMKKRKVKEGDEEVLPIMRRVSRKDMEIFERLEPKEKETLIRARSIAYKEKLEMKIGDVEYRGDGKKVTFYYTAEGRVDFRNLIKIYASEFKAKVEMRQIGSRQEAALIGGIGDCGRELCCSTWLTEFKTVTTNAARYQNLAINQAKLSGQCGRLKCCLNYELDTYLDALQNFPEKADFVFTEKGKAILQKTDIFKGIMYYAYENDYSNFHPLNVNVVKKLLEQNAQNKKPVSLENYEIKEIKEDKIEEADSFLVKDIPIHNRQNKKRKKKYRKQRN